MARGSVRLAEGIGVRLSEDEVKGRLSLSRFLGFALYCTWVLGLFYSAALYDASSDFRAEMYLNLFVSLGTLGLTLLGCALLMKRGDKRVLSRRVVYFATALLAFATAMLRFGSLVDGGLVVLLGSAVATGFSSALLFLGWFRLYADAGSRVIAIEASGAWSVAAFLAIVLGYLPSLASTAIVVGMVVVAGVLLRRCALQRPERPLPAREHALRPRTKRMLLRAALASFSLGAVAGFADVLAGFRYFNIPESYGVVLLTGGMLLAGAGFVVGVLSRTSTVTYFYRIAVLSMTFGCLGIPFMESWQSLPSVVVFGGYVLFLVTLMVVCADVSNYFDLSACKVIGFALFAQYAGEFVGSGCAHWLTLFDVDRVPLDLLAFFLTGAMIVVHQFLFTEKDLVETRIGEMVDSDEEEPSVLSAEEEAARIAGIIASEHGLSARESDVLPLLIKGRTIARIQEELFISQGTVSTHIRHIYQKTGVHNRQALLDLIEETRRRTSKEG